jgi:hypothetical protein
VFLKVLFYPFCPAPSIGDADGKEHADCLSALQTGAFPRAPTVSATRRAVRSTAGHGRFLLVLFSFARKKMNKLEKNRPPKRACFDLY